MAYASITHILARNPERSIGASTIPNATQAAGFLDECAAIIDSTLLEKGYQLPVQAPVTGGASSAWIILQDANAAGGHYKVEWAAQASDKRSEAEDMWQSALRMLKTIQLDIPVDQAESLPRGARGDNVATPFFFREMTL